MRASGISWDMQVCNSLQTDNHASTPPFFTGWMPFLPPNQQRQSTGGSILRLKWYKFNFGVGHMPVPIRGSRHYLTSGLIPGIFWVCSSEFPPPKKKQTLCALNLFFGWDNEHRKLFVIKHSKGCKFMPKMHQKYV